MTKLIDKLKTLKPKRESMHIPEWDTTVWLRAMTFGEYQINAKESEESAKSPKDNQAAIMVIRNTEDENGKSLFTMQDLPDLEQQDSRVIFRIASKIFELTAKKNSLTTTEKSDASPDTSPAAQV